MDDDPNHPEAYPSFCNSASVSQEFFRGSRDSDSADQTLHIGRAECNSPAMEVQLLTSV